MRKREREREREREKERMRERGRERQRERQTERKRDREAMYPWQDENCKRLTSDYQYCLETASTKIVSLLAWAIM